MTKQFLTLSAFILLVGGTLFADEYTDWAGTATNPEIQFRTQVYASSEACFLEFKDLQQGSGPTTFDAEVDYKSKDPDRNEQVNKTDRENIVTTSGHNGNSRIGNCFGVIQIRLSVVERH